MRLQVGDMMPDRKITAAFGTADTLYQLIGGKNTLIWAVRYIGCPPCHYDTTMLARRWERFQSAGANVIVVMQSDPEVLREATAGEDIPFDIVCDPEMAFYRALDIRPAATMEEARGDEAQTKKLMAKGKACAELGYTHGKYEGDEMQLPAVFVVSGEGKVLYAHYAAAIADLPDYDEMAAFMEKL